jgi:prepilin-type N-terminal cleavage/methylation domain-containing protein
MRQTRGFTLIELIVVIGLIATLTGFFVMGSVSSRNATNLDLAVREVESLLLQVQAWGQEGRAASDDVTDPNRFDYGFGVFFDEADPQRLVVYTGDGTGTDPSDENENVYEAAGERTLAEQFVQEYQLTGGVVVDDVRTSTGNTARLHVHFRRGDRGAHLHDENASSFETWVTITLEVGGMERTIRAYNTGLIYVE